MTGSIIMALMEVVKMFLQMGLFLLSPLFVVVLILLLFFLGHYFDLIIFKKNKIPKKLYKKVRHTKTYRLLIQFPRRYWMDRVQSNPNKMNVHGLHLYCGEQGSGKTTALIHDLMALQNEFPKAMVCTNMMYKYEDKKLKNGADIINFQNGEYGAVVVIDEIQNWFSSLESKNFPPELLTEVCQQRKSTKTIWGTSQVFGRVAKPIREQVLTVHCPMTVLGCLTIVRETKPKFWNEEKQIFTRYTKTRFFVHTDEIRNAFDTYHKIKKMKFDRTLLENKE